MISQNKRVLRHLPPPQKKFNKNDKMMIITKISLISLNKKMIIVKIIRIMIIVSNKNNDNSKNKSICNKNNDNSKNKISLISLNKKMTNNKNNDNSK